MRTNELTTKVMILMSLSLLPTAVRAQLPDSPVADRTMSTRAELEALAQRLAASTSAEDVERLRRVRARLADGDFRPGDRIRIEVQGEPALTDTFTVTNDRSVLLPPPVTRPLPLQGVLRSELEAKVSTFLG